MIICSPMIAPKWGAHLPRTSPCSGRCQGVPWRVIDANYEAL